MYRQGNPVAYDLDMANAISPYTMPAKVDPRIADVEGLARWLDYAFVENTCKRILRAAKRR
jgi:hypothetical protein